MRHAFPLGALIGALSLAGAQSAAAAPVNTPVTGISAAGDAIAKAADGSMWLTEPASPGRVARVSPAGAVTEYTGGVTPNFLAGRSPDKIALTSDGYAWFLLHSGTDEVGGISMSTGAVYRYELTAGTPNAVAAGSDGRLWMSANGDTTSTDFVAAFDRVTNTTQAFQTGFTSTTEPRTLTTASDGSMAFVEGAGAGRLGRITTDGTVTFRSIGAAPTALGVGPTGMWFARNTEFGLIGANSTSLFDVGAAATAVAAGPDDAMWGAITGGVVRVAPDGSVNTYSAGLDPSAKGTGIAAGPDGRMWMTLDRSPYLVRITVPPRVGAASAQPTAATTATVSGTVRPNGLATTASVQLRSAEGQWSTLTSTSVADLNATSPVSFDVSGLAPGSRQDLRVVATNSAGQSLSDPVAVTTPASPPPATTPPATTPPATTPPATTPPATTPPATTPPETTPPASTPPVTTPPITTPPVITPPITTPEVTTPEVKIPLVTTPPVVQDPEDRTPPASTPTEAAPATPTPAAATPAAPAPSATPAPVQGSTLIVRPGDGTVRYRVPGSDATRVVDSAASIPSGSIVDTTKGTVLLSSRVGATEQQGRFSGGEFKVTQVKATGATRLYLTEKLDCSKSGTKAVRLAKKKTRRHVWGQDRGGNFETHGKDSVATVRGTKWLTTDTCAGTTVKVFEGAVSVKPRRGKGKAVLVRAGGRNFVPAPR